MAGLCSVDHGGVLLMHKHFQMMVKGNFSSLPVLNKKEPKFIWGGMRILQQVMWFLARGGKMRVCIRSWEWPGVG